MFCLTIDLFRGMRRTSFDAGLLEQYMMPTMEEHTHHLDGDSQDRQGTPPVVRSCEPVMNDKR